MITAAASPGVGAADAGVAVDAGRRGIDHDHHNDPAGARHHPRRTIGTATEPRVVCQ